MREKTNIWNIVRFAGAYIAYIIGSGFATGQEIIQFYTSYGYLSIGAILISMFLSWWLDMTTEMKKKAENTNVFVESILELFMHILCQYSCFV